jgi:hypothetical protein
MFIRQVVDPAEDRHVGVHLVFRCDVHEAVIFDVEIWAAEIQLFAVRLCNRCTLRVVR